MIGLLLSVSAASGFLGYVIGTRHVEHYAAELYRTRNRLYELGEDPFPGGRRGR